MAGTYNVSGLQPQQPGGGKIELSLTKSPEAAKGLAEGLNNSKAGAEQKKHVTLTHLNAAFSATHKKKANQTKINANVSQFLKTISDPSCRAEINRLKGTGTPFGEWLKTCDTESAKQIVGSSTAKFPGIGVTERTMAFPDASKADAQLRQALGLSSTKASRTEGHLFSTSKDPLIDTMNESDIRQRLDFDVTTMSELHLKTATAGEPLFFENGNNLLMAVKNERDGAVHIYKLEAKIASESSRVTGQFTANMHVAREMNPHEGTDGGLTFRPAGKEVQKPISEVLQNAQKPADPGKKRIYGVTESSSSTTTGPSGLDIKVNTGLLPSSPPPASTDEHTYIAPIGKNGIHLPAFQEIDPTGIPTMPAQNSFA